MEEVEVSYRTPTQDRPWRWQVSPKGGLVILDIFNTLSALRAASKDRWKMIFKGRKN